MAKFVDIYDEMDQADDWMIASEEISKRRLLKQTPRYNVYKADWFGDVLVYEPRRKQTDVTAIDTNHKANHIAPLSPSIFRDHQNREHQSLMDSCLNSDELNFRLNKLNLGQPNDWAAMKSKSQMSLASDGCDSAYSSLSSTPQCHTKSQTPEFRFPSGLSSPTASFGVASNNSAIFFGSPNRNAQSTFVDNNNNNNKQHSSSDRQVVKQSGTPMILNKESYHFGSYEANKRQQLQTTSENDDHFHTISRWDELNELRLVAHEGFMLFMGASLNEPLGDEIDHSTSLVIQMNHPKAVALFYLLHSSRIKLAPNSQSTTR